MREDRKEDRGLSLRHSNVKKLARWEGTSKGDWRELAREAGEKIRERVGEASWEELGIKEVEGSTVSKVAERPGTNRTKTKNLAM